MLKRTSLKVTFKVIAFGNLETTPSFASEFLQYVLHCSLKETFLWLVSSKRVCLDRDGG